MHPFSALFQNFQTGIALKQFSYQQSFAGFVKGKYVYILSNIFPFSVTSFAINLQCGPNTNPRDDLALHLNIRIQERAVVRNSLIGGHWGQEERHGSVFPFVPGQGFEILLLAEVNNYKVSSAAIYWLKAELNNK